MNLTPMRMSAAKLPGGFLRLAKQLYSAEETNARCHQFKQRLKTSPHFAARKKSCELPLAA